MCLIIDASRAHCLAEKNSNELGKKIISRLVEGKIKLATGGKNLAELVKAGTDVATFLLQLNRSGDLYRYSDAVLTAETAKAEKNLRIRSNDAHNVALAKLSGAHVIVTDDDELASDFRDSQIVPMRANCRKTVLRDEAHSQTLEKTRCCGCFPPNL